MTSNGREALPFFPRTLQLCIREPRLTSSTPQVCGFRRRGRACLKDGKRRYFSSRRLRGRNAPDQVRIKALELDLYVIVCINKIDRPEARPNEVIDEI